MRYLALACDYDGTLATKGAVSEETCASLEGLLASGRKLVMVTGRQLDDLRTVFNRFELFDWIVAENGAVLYSPARREERTLASPPPEPFINLLRKRGVEPLSVGRVIVATWHPHEAAVLEAIRELGLELHVIFNKDAVMVLPSGVNKATGLAAALKEMGLSPHNVVGIGDAENDHAFLQLCECAVAVDNALPALKEHADLVTARDHGAGVTELIDRLIRDDLAELEEKLHRHALLLGTARDGSEVRIPPYHVNVLVAGPSGSGKSSAATALLERLAAQRYQFCVIDPEGDYDNLETAVAVGGTRREPDLDEVMTLLQNPRDNVTVNMVGLPMADRPGWFLTLFARLQEMRTRTGRPHWLLLDEAHHLLPTSWQPGAAAVPQKLDRLLMITVHPKDVSATVLKSVNTLIAVGKDPGSTIGDFCKVVGDYAPEQKMPELEKHEVLVWSRGHDPVVVRVLPARVEHHRHTRKYAEGELPPDQSFYFRGPEGKLNLRAQNLVLFNQIADGVDDATWEHHLRQGDYSRWFREYIKDEGLAKEANEIEGDQELSSEESRKRVRAAIERRYTV